MSPRSASSPPAYFSREPVYVLDAVRTPVGRARSGALAKVHPCDLGAWEGNASKVCGIAGKALRIEDALYRCRGTAPRVFVSTLVPARDPPRGGTAGQRHWPPLCSPPCSSARPAAWTSLATLAVLRAACFAVCSVRALGSRELGARRLVQGARCQARAQFARSACCVAADSVRAGSGLGARGLAKATGRRRVRLPLLATLEVLRAACFAACSVLPGARRSVLGAGCGLGPRVLRAASQRAQSARSVHAGSTLGVVLLAEQLNLLGESGLVGASKCRHETVDTVLQ
ncbi:hypothetical protein PPROV_000018900 [Pycnococcus provasolii]|uniref:Uncharacterized protein n=1 Tax=Pycnococcus provasolii TaxID=41880 RepID=A0A830H595_9CHLO|nr:hypothetical protein PPROV_000018900 [Pycnococcus provasolii]